MVAPTTMAVVVCGGPSVDIAGVGVNAVFRAGDSLKTPVWIAGSWSATVNKASKPLAVSLNGRACSVNVHGSRYDT
jgi:hypothetical protein